MSLQVLDLRTWRDPSGVHCAVNGCTGSPPVGGMPGREVRIGTLSRTDETGTVVLATADDVPDEAEPS